MKETEQNLRIRSEQRLQNEEAEMKNFVDGDENQNGDKQPTKKWKQMETRKQEVKRQNNEFARHEVASDKSKEQEIKEEMYCLVRQFDIEQPINPASLTFCDIASC
eukprot:Seg4214.3 transcript_id=Seg4214.3/GoldUCD/mRNA.D3Y31 product="hypothetical protein" protein_id=Seg4214.3/GoldUCD/D3Y31